MWLLKLGTFHSKSFHIHPSFLKAEKAAQRKSTFLSDHFSYTIEVLLSRCIPQL